ncbi:MAG: methyltransferase family protein [Promethearchaeota archaeon]
MIKDILKKLIAICFLILFINIGFIIFALEVYFNLISLIVLISFTFILCFDIAVRPISKEKDQFKYPILSIVLFLLLPFICIIPYIEFKFIILRFITIWNSFSIYLIGISVLLVGSIILLYSRALLGKFASSKIVIEQNHVLTTKGIYKYIRHPIYLGMLLIFFGYALSFKSIITPFSFLVLFFLIFNNRMNLEEKLLIEKFGEEYELYINKTKRIIPYIY